MKKNLYIIRKFKNVSLEVSNFLKYVRESKKEIHVLLVDFDGPFYYFDYSCTVNGVSSPRFSFCTPDKGMFDKIYRTYFESPDVCPFGLFDFLYFHSDENTSILSDADR